MEAGPAARMAKEGRFTACVVEGGPRNNTMALATVYLDPTPSADEDNEARIIACLAWARGLGHGAWAIGGDWNRHPTALRADLLSPLSATVVAPSAPTCHSSTGAPTCIDWWILGADLAARSPSAGTWAETALPTHKPVELRLTGPCRPLTVTALRRPTALLHY